ncbi:PASTA domain-containing protein [Spirochaetia bacterium 38H-sp]|uniref:PASTA domain-containing protein n=1 Tax=Rarispira pelagica TaxID=3141764 RepID=A0ABU9U9R6_9SPIR
MKQIIDKVKNSIPKSADEPAKKWFSFFIYGSLFLVFLMGIVALSVFFLLIQSPEEILVPELEGKDFIEAVVTLQKYQLYPHVELRYSSDPETKGKVLEQSPAPGATVQAKKEIRLVVSLGAVVDKVKDFRGKTLDEVALELKSMFAPYEPLISIKEPITYVYSDQPPDTVIEQKPEPGTPVTGKMELELVLSRGNAPQTVEIPNLVGKSYSYAISELSVLNLPFIFTEAESGGEADVEPGIITEQSPEPGKKLAVGSRVNLKFVMPKRKGSLYPGFFDYTLPSYPVAVDLRVDVESSNGLVSTLFELKHPGGRISFPYLLKAGDKIILYVYEQKMTEQVVTK